MISDCQAHFFFLDSIPNPSLDLRIHINKESTFHSFYPLEALLLFHFCLHFSFQTFSHFAFQALLSFLRLFAFLATTTNSENQNKPNSVFAPQLLPHFCPQFYIPTFFHCLILNYFQLFSFLSFFLFSSFLATTLYLLLHLCHHPTDSEIRVRGDPCETRPTISSTPSPARLLLSPMVGVTIIKHGQENSHTHQLIHQIKSNQKDMLGPNMSQGTSHMILDER